MSPENSKMMNVLALGFLVSSLAAAGVFSPPPDPKPQQHDQTHDERLVREGHRLIVVEYERQVAHEPPQPPPPTAHHLLEEVKEKFQEAASYLPNLSRDLTAPLAHEVDKRPGETHQPGDAIKDYAGTMMAGVEDVSSNISTIAQIGLNKSQELGKAALGKVKEVGGAAVDKAQVLGEAAVDKARDACHAAVDKAKGAGHAVIDKTKDAGKAFVVKAKDEGEPAVGKAKHVRQAAIDKAEKAGEAAEELRRNLTDIIRRARDVLCDAAAYVWAPETARATAAVAQLLAFAVAYGTMVWVTFVSSYVLAGALPRQQFGLVQSKLYPVYFRAVACSIGTAFLAQFFGPNRKLLAERVQGCNLLAALGLVLVNMLFLEPKATKVMFERMKIEKEEGRGRDMADAAMEPSAATIRAAAFMPPAACGITRTEAGADPELVKSRLVKLNKRLKNLNSYSSFLNILTLMSLSWHLVHLARRLQTSA